MSAHPRGILANIRSQLIDSISGFAPLELADDKVYELPTSTGVGHYWRHNRQYTS